MLEKKTGTLYVVATPIGNLGDITYRAVEVLRQVDCIAAEDTRHSRRLMQYYDIPTPMRSLHAHNEASKTPVFVNQLLSGQDIALISDAGTPLLSDPGYSLVCSAHEAGCAVVSVPGPCAAVAALSVAGLPCHAFVFEGFLPPKTQQRRRRLMALSHETRTLVFFEAPHRLMACLEDMIALFDSERPAVLARELTKTFETVYRGSLSSLQQRLAEFPEEQKGACVFLVGGAVVDAATLTSSDRKTAKALAEVLPHKNAAQLAASLTGKRKRAFYAYLAGL